VNSRNIKHLPFKKLGRNIKAIDTIVAQPRNISIGNNVGFNFHTLIDGTGDLYIGNDTIIGPFTVISTANHRYNCLDLPIRNQGSIRKRVVIGNNVWIGAHCNILAGAEIDNGCVIGAGSIITKHIPKDSIVIGVNEIIKKRDIKDTTAIDDISPRNRAMLCLNTDGSFCKIKNLVIKDGYASLYHCGDCGSFEAGEV